MEWNLEDLTKGVAPDQLIDELKDMVAEFSAHRDELEGISPKRLRELIEEYEGIEERSSVISGVLSLRFSEDTHDEQVLALRSKWSQIATSLGNELIFFTHWYTFLPDEQAQEYLEADELEEYRYFLERLRAFKPFTLDEETEQVIALTTSGSSPSQLYSILRGSFSFELYGETVTEEEVKSRIHDHDAGVREQAYRSLFEPFQKNRTLLTEIYKGVVLNFHNEEISVRGHERPIDVRNLSNDVTTKAVEALVSAVRKNQHRMRRYYALKRRLNGHSYPYSRFHLYAPYKDQPKVSYDFSTSRDLVLSVFADFDPRFERLAREVFDAEHVHAFPKQRKRVGAFSYAVTTRTEPYVMLNHTGELQDVFTMAHEFGHAVHSQFERDNVELLSHAGLPLAETASLFAELLLTERFLESSKSDAEKIAVLVENLDGFYASVIRQIGFLSFELKAHELIPQGASRSELNAAYREILDEQFDHMDDLDVFEDEWSFVPHIHGRPFYVYAYAWGNLLVLALYEQWQQEGDAFKERYVKLLKAGGTKPPMELLAELGVDVESEAFWAKGFDAVDAQIDELESLL